MGNQSSAQPFIQYAVPVADPPYEDCTPVFRYAGYPTGLVKDLPGTPWSSIWDIFQYRLKKAGFRHKNFIGSRLWNSARQETLSDVLPGSEVNWVTYGEVEELALNLALGIRHRNLAPPTHFPTERYEPARELNFLGIMSKNRPEWFITELASSAGGLTLVPLYDSLGDAALLHILSQTRMTVLACSTESFLTIATLLAKRASPECPEELKQYNSELKMFILFDRPSDRVSEIAGEIECDFVYWKDLVETGRRYLGEKLPYQKGEEVGTLCYTSGTTAAPKGVILTCENYCSVVAAHQRSIMAHPGFRTDHRDIHISYLPLAHVFERIICANCFALGVRIACYSGDTQKLLDDMRVIRPTVFLSVPRLFSRIHDRVFSTMESKSGVARFLFQTAIDHKVKNLREAGVYQHSIWDPLIFAKMRKLLGGCVRAMLVGGAPLEAIVQEHISVMFCCPLLHGFGMTEMGATFICDPGERQAGHIGGVQPCIEFMLKSVPDMDYVANDMREARGELMVRGPSVMAGYLMNAEDTDKVIDSNGWLSSGDIAVLLPGNAIKIIDRRKNIFKLAQGEYVAPEKIEAIYSRASLVGQIMIHGDSTKHQLVAVVVPEEEASAKWLSENNLPFSSIAEICSNEEFANAVLASMNHAAVQGGLKGFEKIKAIRLTSEAFTVDNNLLTPTLKLRRHIAREKFAKEIADMYNQLQSQQTQQQTKS